MQPEDYPVQARALEGLCHVMIKAQSALEIYKILATFLQNQVVVYAHRLSAVDAFQVEVVVSKYSQDI